MGRSAGFLALHASLASRDVNVCLIPEAPWRLAQLCAHLEARLDRSGHAVIVVAEGAVSLERREERAIAAAAAVAAGKPLAARTDESGNECLEDVGEYLRSGILAHFKRAKLPCNVKLIDPSYVVRAAPANPADSDYCTTLAYNALHGALGGRQSFSVGTVEGAPVWLPISLITSSPSRCVDVKSRAYARLMSSTGQPDLV